MVSRRPSSDCSGRFRPTDLSNLMIYRRLPDEPWIGFERVGLHRHDEKGFVISRSEVRLLSSAPGLEPVSGLRPTNRLFSCARRTAAVYGLSMVSALLARPVAGLSGMLPPDPQAKRHSRHCGEKHRIGADREKRVDHDAHRVERSLLSRVNEWPIDGPYMSAAPPPPDRMMALALRRDRFARTRRNAKCIREGD